MTLMGEKHKTFGVSTEQTGGNRIISGRWESTTKAFEVFSYKNAGLLPIWGTLTAPLDASDRLLDPQSPAV